MPGRDIRVEVIRLSEIYVVGERRPLDEAAVRQLAASIESIGLQHPITVRYVTDIVLPDEEEPLAGFRLIAGAHRLEAHKRLGLESIDCVVVRWSDRDARKWEIAENLHRADLTELQRKLEIAEWIRITEEEAAAGISGQNAPKIGRGRPEGGTARAARELGIQEMEAKRAVKIASISERARQAAIDAGLADSQNALLGIARAGDEDAQVVRVQEIADGREQARLAHQRAREQSAMERLREQRSAERKPVSPAPAVRNEYESYQAFLNKVVKLFDGVPQEWREAACEHVLADTPVMDRGAA